MRNWIVAAVAALGALLAPAAAEAANGYTTGNVNMRAGPGVDYPRILVLPAGAPVTIYGCLQGYSWCDVAAYHERGWVSSRYLDSFYDDRRVYVPYRPRVEVPIIRFEFGYWDRWYRERPWYRDRRWRDEPSFPDRPTNRLPRVPDEPGWGNRELPSNRLPRQYGGRDSGNVISLPEEPGVYDGGAGVERPRRCRAGDPRCDPNAGVEILDGEPVFRGEPGVGN